MKYIITTTLALFIGAGAVFALTKVGKPVWEFFPDKQDMNTYFSSTEQIKVYKFTDASTTCFIAVSPAQTTNNAMANKIYNTALSCIK